MDALFGSQRLPSIQSNLQGNLHELWHSSRIPQEVLTSFSTVFSDAEALYKHRAAPFPQTEYGRSVPNQVSHLLCNILVATLVRSLVAILFASLFLVFVGRGKTVALPP